MSCLELLSNTIKECNSYQKEKTIKIMIFTEGTILGPKNIFRHFDHASYIPIKDSVNLIKSWQQQGTEIMYLTSRKKEKHIHEIKNLLLKNHFPGQCLFYRGEGQRYKDIVELVIPDILIEDDCWSIGGKWQMAITYVEPEIKDKVKSIIVKEFTGIDNLPLQVTELLNFQTK